MPRFRFSDTSRQRLLSCDPRLINVMTKVMGWQVLDFTVLEGHRSPERQQQLYEMRDDQGRRFTNVKWSKHNYRPSRAVDIAPYPIDWNDTFRFHLLAGVVYAAAAQEGFPIRWGGDWDSDRDQSDHTLIDMPHYELLED